MSSPASQNVTADSSGPDSPNGSELEEQLRQSEELFHHLVDAVTDYAIFVLDATGHVATWNVGAKKIKGYDASEIIGSHFSVFYTESDRRAGRPERILETVRREGRFAEENWRVRKNGTEFWASVVLTALRNDQGQVIGFAKVTRDLTERREAELMQHKLWQEQSARAHAEQLTIKAEEANRIKDEFLATVSHELRTPLNAIVGWTLLLRQQTLEPKVAKAVEVIDRNAQAQVKIIEDILDVSRIVTGKLRIEPKPMDLVLVTKDAIDVIRAAAIAKQLSVEFSAEAEAHVLIGDAERLRQVIWNLLSNAVKFSDPGGQIRIAIERDSDGRQLTLSVSDTGRGIEPEFLPFVFDRFKQADSSITRRVGGLGLALVRHIVELHGGSVSAESPGVGRGSRFSITLPTRVAIPASTPAETAALSEHAGSPASSELLPGIRVLVVDDDADARELLSLVLERAGAEVMTADSAQLGFQTLLDFHPDVLISDIGMAAEDGYSFLRRVRELTREAGGRVPALALSAYARAEDRVKALNAGFTTHIGKPLRPNDLLAAVAELAFAPAASSES